MELTKRIEEEINRFPEGSKNHSFLKQLLKNLEPDCLRESVRKELNESHADLSESMRQYFKNHIIYASAVKAINGGQSKRKETAHDNAELFHLNLLKKHVHNDKSGEKLKLFESSKEFLTKLLEDKEKSKSVKVFSKFVEAEISEFCIQFSQYILEGKVHLLDCEKHFGAELEKLSSEVAVLDSADVRLNGAAPELRKVLSAYHKELAEGIEILNKIFELFQQKLDCQYNQSKVAVDRSAHLSLKLKCLELEVLVSTYSESAVKALKIIREELINKIEKSQESIDKINNKLEEFHISGPEYNELVEKYQQLIENIEKQKSAIEYLKADIASKDNLN